MPSVFITRRLPSSVLSRLREAADVDLYSGDAAIPAGELRERVADKDALVCVLTNAIDRSVIDAAARLKIVANVGVGYHNIDVPYARSRNIVVTNTPDVLTESVADFTWALILAITRRLSEGERVVRRGEWKGGALDVYENEPAVHADLLGLENVLLVPHLASGTMETRTAMA